MTTQMAHIELSDMQLQAVHSIENWYTTKHSEQTYFLAGYAGTGKSTLVHYVIEKLKLKRDRVAYACYTGKAALVLTRKSHGQFRAQTIHKLIYDLEEKAGGGTSFVLKDKRDLKHLKLIVIDEASMVDGEVMRDLKSFGIKILFVGDQGQLPPVSQNGNEEFLQMFNNPNFALTEIHRQAQDNPIIYLSFLARTGQPIPYGKFGANGEVLVVTKAQWNGIKQACFTTADQIICGTNKTRHALNKEIRSYIGFHSQLPQVGDKMICTKNNWSKKISDVNLVNGMTGFVQKIETEFEPPRDFSLQRPAIKLNFRPDFSEKEEFKELYSVRDHFEGRDYKLHPYEYSQFCDFDFGYAITCHKSQGSQWDKVVVISETLNREMHHRWLYTAITRSSDKLVLVI